MKFYSHLNKNKYFSFKDAVLKGLADNGGLFMPESIPKMSDDFFLNLSSLSFQEIAFQISKEYLNEDLNEEEIREIVESAFDFPLELKKLDEDLFCLELFHGPTLAFKDFAARFMAKLFSTFLDPKDEKIKILAATSGDTGSAVASGFLGAEIIDVVILYPSKKVSEIQEKQLTSMGQNVKALEIEGTFDDCQTLVKKAFQDKELKNLSSANSINIARLIPQSFYYFYAYAQLKKQFPDEDFETAICVPCGNLGNITAGLIAKKMGLNISKFIAANNANDVVFHYLKSGQFNPKKSVKTISNAMDVGNPSNFTRILELFADDIEKIRNNINGFSYNDEETAQAIKQCKDKYSYLLDPHGAVAFCGISEYLKSRKDKSTKGIFLQTAHAAKFIDDVEKITKEKVEVPQRLKECLGKKKKSILMPNDYNEFKSWLLNN